jgi:hypothetical protein
MPDKNQNDMAAAPGGGGRGFENAGRLKEWRARACCFPACFTSADKDLSLKRLH